MLGEKNENLNNRPDSFIPDMRVWHLFLNDQQCFERVHLE